PRVEIAGEGEPGEVGVLQHRRYRAVAVKLADHQRNQDPEDGEVDQREQGLVEPEEQETPRKVRNELRKEEPERAVRLFPASSRSPDKAGADRHQRVERGPDDAEQETRRISRGLVEREIPG